MNRLVARPLEVDGGESSNKRARNLAGMLLWWKWHIRLAGHSLGGAVDRCAWWTRQTGDLDGSNNTVRHRCSRCVEMLDWAEVGLVWWQEWQVAWSRESDQRKTDRAQTHEWSSRLRLDLWSRDSEGHQGGNFSLARWPQTTWRWWKYRSQSHCCATVQCWQTPRCSSGHATAESVENVACIGHEQRFTPTEGVWNLGRQCCVLSFSNGWIHRGETTGGVASAWQAMGSEESTVWHSDGQQVFWEIGGWSSEGCSVWSSHNYPQEQKRLDPIIPEQATHPISVECPERWFQILLNCEILMFVSCTSNLLGQMYDFQRCTKFLQKWILNLQDLLRSQSLETVPICIALAVFPT